MSCAVKSCATTQVVHSYTCAQILQFVVLVVQLSVLLMYTVSQKMTNSKTTETVRHKCLRILEIHAGFQIIVMYMYTSNKCLFSVGLIYCSYRSM